MSLNLLSDIAFYFFNGLFQNKVLEPHTNPRGTEIFLGKIRVVR
jgi:hypothetical protein